MKFNRDLYLQKLISASKNDMIKIVTGIRRCGKSYLLFEIFRNYLLSQGVAEDHIIGLALDDNRNKDFRNPDKLLEYIDSQLIQDGQTSYVILDEVQMVDDFVGVLLRMKKGISFINELKWTTLLTVVHSAYMCNRHTRCRMRRNAIKSNDR